MHARPMPTFTRPAGPADAAAWERMRQALWPSAPGEHAGEISGFFAGMIDEPMQVLVAVDEAGGVVGMVELSIRRAAEGCFSDRVAYVEGWFVEPKFRRRGIGAALV